MNTPMIVTVQPLPVPPVNLNLERFVLAYAPEAELLTWPQAVDLAEDRMAAASRVFVLDLTAADVL